jgi:HEAT repeat protein/cyclophilin family peptidyl-prolyl cis-trans isomerase
MIRRQTLVAAVLVLFTLSVPSPGAQARPPLSAANIDDIATLLKLEDTRQLDETALARILKSAHPEVRRRAAVSIGRIADPKGLPLLETARGDADVDVRASVVFATGQLRDASTVAWLGTVLSAPATPPVVAREAAQALGKITAPEARAALSKYLAAAPATAAAAPVVGEALLSWGRFTGAADIAPIVRWITSLDVEIRWRATWALFRPRDPAAMPHLVTLTADPSGDVRYWAVRGLAPAAVDAAKMDRAVATGRLERIVQTDKDRRVRTEALRVLVQYDDERAFLAVANALYSPDTWLSVSAAEGAGRFVTRALPLAPLVLDVSGEKAPTALRITCLNALVTLAPIATKTFDLAVSLAKSDVGAARSAAIQALTRLGDEGLAKLKELAADPAVAKLAQPGGQTFEAMAQAAITRAGGAGGRAGGGAAGGGRGNRGTGATVTRTPRPDSEYRQLVERWIVPAYTGAAAPGAIWVTPKGEIELELYPGDAPFGVEHFMRVVESGDIVGTEFTRLVPNFVAQQQAIRNASTLRDEVNRRGLTRANLSWASAGLDTGRPGYTLGHTPQPHNEGNFTSLGRVIRGMDVVDRLELGDRITAARMVR